MRIGDWSSDVCSSDLSAAVMIAPYGTGAEDERKIAESLAEFLRSARAVIGSSQPLINRASAEDKGLTGDEVVRRAVEIYRETTGTDPLAIDPASREGELLRAQMAAVREVMDENQTTINNPSLGFKGRSEEHTSELQSLMSNSYAVFCLKKRNNRTKHRK